MPEVAENPCVFKSACKTCKWVEMQFRPIQCEALKCPDYTPCAKCGRNLKLYADKKCASCSKDSEAKQQKKQQQNELHEPAQSVSPSLPEPRKFSITVPGTAPPEYNDEERSNYDEQWREYSGYYRDPSAYPICHAIILAVIELNHVNTAVINCRMEDDETYTALEKRRGRIVDMLAKLRGQLPEREALEFSEDEKAIAAIYERYAEEKLKRGVGGISRVLSPEAIALAPSLHFPVGLADLLTRLKYDPISIERALQQIIPSSELPKDPLVLLEALGMFVREKVVPLQAIGRDIAGTIDPAFDPDDPDFPEEKG